jgi:hypothetical protein
MLPTILEIALLDAVISEEPLICQGKLDNKGKQTSMYNVSYIDSFQTGEFNGTTNTKAAPFYRGRSHSVVIKRGQTKTWVDYLRLIRALPSSVITNKAAAGSGCQM